MNAETYGIFRRKNPWLLLPPFWELTPENVARLETLDEKELRVKRIAVLLSRSSYMLALDAANFE